MRGYFWRKSLKIAKILEILRSAAVSDQRSAFEAAL
jgi:hypothetical protein